MAGQLLTNLECHFKWKPEIGSTRKLEEVCQTTLDRIKDDPLNKVGYYTVLAYIYAQRETADYRESEKYLCLAEDVCRSVQNSTLSTAYLSSQFVIDANRLCIQKQRQPNLKDLPIKFQALQTQWEQMDDLLKAAVFAVKGIAMFRFGFIKYPDVIDAFAEANRLGGRRNFLYLYGEAQFRARVRRSNDFCHPAPDDELQLWHEAYDLSTQAPPEFNRTELSIFYAEAILNNRRLHLCKTLTDEVWNYIRGLELSIQAQHHRSIMRCAKCYRIIKQLSQKDDVSQKDDDEALLLNTVAQEIDSNLTAIMKCLWQIKDDIPKANLASILFIAAKDFKKAGKLDECKSLLEKAQETSERPGHIWVDLMLIDVKKLEIGDQYTVDNCLAEYDTLITRYSSSSNNAASVTLHKGEFQVSQSFMKDAIQTLIEANNRDSKCWNRFESEKALSLFLSMSAHGPKEYLAWLLEHGKSQTSKFKELQEFEKRTSDPEIEKLYKESLEEDQNNSFALEHLGRFYLERDRFCEAESCFQSLPDEHESKSSLIAKLTIRKPDSNIAELERCLDCGYKDAAINILNILLSQKSKYKVNLRVLGEASNSFPDSQNPLFFKKSVYELCSKIRTVAHNAENDIEGRVTKQINDLLELNCLMSRREKLNNTNQSSTERGNLLRSNRLEMTRLYLLKSATNQRELSNLIVSVLKESKEVLDRSLAIRLHGKSREFSYPHAFSQMRNELGGKFKIELKKLETETERKKLEMESLIKMLKEKPELTKHENIRKSLKSAFNKIDSNFDQNANTRDLFDFMVSREHRILSSEHCWIIRWIYPVNKEKHEAEILVDELNNELRSDCSGDGDCRSAYDVAHLAAEFAEETWAVFSSGVC